MASQIHHPEKSAIALVLTFTAGSVDIVGYLSAYHTFVAHMTGTTVHLGNALFNREAGNAALSAMILALFICGSLVGRAIVEIGARHKIRSIASLTLGIEAVLLTIVASQALGGFISGDAPHYPKVMLGLLATAMGLQTATITRVGALTVHTTFVTGMINKLCQLVSQIIFDTYDIATANSASLERCRTHRERTVRGALFIFAIWACYVAGAIGGTWLQSRWQLRGLYLPVTLLCLAIATDQFVPLSIEEEKDQAER